MREFQAAWNRLDADGVRRAFPAFAGDSSPRFQNFMLQLESPQVTISGTHATVKTLARHVPRGAGGKGRFGRSNEAIFRFEQRNGQWLMLGNQPVTKEAPPQR